MMMAKSAVLANVILFVIFTGNCLAEEKSKLKTFNLEDIVVTATKTERNLANVAQTVNIITEKEIFRCKI